MYVIWCINIQTGANSCFGIYGISSARPRFDLNQRHASWSTKPVQSQPGLSQNNIAYVSHTVQLGRSRYESDALNFHGLP